MFSDNRSQKGDADIFIIDRNGLDRSRKKGVRLSQLLYPTYFGELSIYA